MTVAASLRDALLASWNRTESASDSEAATSVEMCVSNLVIPGGARDLTYNRGFARSFAFAQDDN